MRHFQALSLLALFLLPAIGQAKMSLPAQTQSANSDLAAGFAGKWVGQLEYRDFGDGSRVFLPTWLTVTADGNAAHFQFVYDDGPTKTVREALTLRFDPSAGTVTVTSDRDKSTDTYQAEGFPEFTKLGRGVLKLSGTGTENDKKVDVRITLTLRRNLYVFGKETRLPGEDFKFRDQYTMTRAQEPRSGN